MMYRAKRLAEVYCSNLPTEFEKSLTLPQDHQLRQQLFAFYNLLTWSQLKRCEGHFPNLCCFFSWHTHTESGVLAGKTRILVTNDVKYLRHMDSIVVLREGRIAERGTYEELMDNDGAFAEFLRNYDNNKTGNSGGSRGGGGSGHRVLARRISEIRKERRKNMRQQVRKSFARQVSESYATVRAFSRSGRAA